MATDTEGEFVTKEADILRMFRQAKQQMAPVTLVFPERHRSLTTYLVEIKPRERLLVLDEPMPKVMARYLAAGESFTLETYFDGVRIRARQLSARSIGTNADPRYECPLPIELYYLQRRKSFRASARRSLIVDARVVSESGEARYGVLRDMSVEGCRLEFEGDLTEFYTQQDETLAIELTFPNETQLSFQANMLRSDYDDSTGVTGIGCQYTALLAQLEVQFSAIVTDLQRDHINFVKNGGNRDEIPARFLLPNGEVPTRFKPHRNKAAGVPKASAKTPELSAPVDSSAAWRNTLAAVRKQQANNKAEVSTELVESLRTLSQAWNQDRFGLLLLSRIRSKDNSDIEQRLATSLVQADHQVRSPSAKNAYADAGITPWMTHALLRRLGAKEQPMAKLISAVDRLAYKVVDDQVFYRPTAALGALHKQEAFDARLIQQLIATQGLYPLGSCVRLSNGCAGLVLRHNDKNHPTRVRQLYKLSEQSPLPPRDIDLVGEAIEVEGPADPVKLGLPVELLRPAVRA
ncbi:flagellar brake protein [Saccharospirillum impatiens]|uniref:flagellar brake protein n=1 Tax=Saccharospirillum impatiens TaxID=169438 RepID=UPI0004146635|nr:flagellar brake protein [Saccharospirillum impatiens]